MGATVSKLLPALMGLDRQEKLFVIQYLVSGLSQEEGVSIMPNMQYPVWSPFEAHGAASVLAKLLEETKK